MVEGVGEDDDFRVNWIWVHLDYHAIERSVLGPQAQVVGW